MSDAKERTAIIEKATSLGFDPEELIRLPTYVISQKLQEIQPMEEHYQEDDDTGTVIDMPLFDNPGDKNYSRLQFLVETQKSLKSAIESNISALKTCTNDFENDDIVVLRKEIDCAQTHLRLIDPELRDLKLWFAGQRAQKLEFYKAIAPKLVDTSGELTTHFKNKMMKIDNQLKSLQHLEPC
jgi:cytochrome c551/c552